MTHAERLAQARFKRDYWIKEVARLEGLDPERNRPREATQAERENDARVQHAWMRVK